MLLAAHNSRSSAVHYKNKFLNSKSKISIRLINFFNFKGDLRTQQIIAYKFYLLFCRSFYYVLSSNPQVTFIRNLFDLNPDFIKLFTSNPHLLSFDHCYLSRCSDLIPNVKVVLVLKKQKKVKKTKKLKKYTQEYRLIKPAVRLQTLNR